MAEVWDVQQLKLTWETRRDAPREMRRGVAVAHGSVGYFSSYLSYDVFAYDSEKDDWKKLPKCPHMNFGLAVVNNFLTAVGGLSDGKHTNRLVSFNGSKWKTIFPPMPTKRCYPVVISAQNYLIAAGGQGKRMSVLSTVEVMNIATQEWYTAAGLPEPVYRMSVTVCGGRLYLLGGEDKTSEPTHAVFTCTMNSLVHSCHPPSKTPPHTNEAVWQRIADVPMLGSTCTTLNGRVLAVGGKDSDGTSTANVYMYNADSESWPLVGHMSTARYVCLVVELRDCIIAVGGPSSSVEVGYLQLSDGGRGSNPPPLAGPPGMRQSVRPPPSKASTNRRMSGGAPKRPAPPPPVAKAPAPPPDPPEESADLSYSVLTTDGGRGSDSPPGMRQSVLGPKIMPSFNPAEARSKLKKSASVPAPPPSKASTDRRMSGGVPKKPVPLPRVAKAPKKLPSKPPENQVEQAKVVFDYTAEQPDELTIKVGEILDVVSKELDDQDGWWEVRREDQTGLIPDNFVELFPQSQPPPVPTRSSKTEPPPSKASTYRRMSGGVPKKPVPLPRVAKAPKKLPSKPPENQVEQAKVVFDYTAEQPDELTIKVGEILDVVSKELDGQDGWWEVRRGDQTGLIPDNFVELLPQPQPPPAPTPSSKTEPPPSKVSTNRRMSGGAPKRPAPPPPVAKAPATRSSSDITDFWDPGKHLFKQQSVRCDDLIHEFEVLTTDQDGLLGVLEDTLHEYGSGANFEAKKLLCALFQESYDNCKEAVIYHISVWLYKHFVELSRDGLLLSACSLRTEEMQAQYSTQIKEKSKKTEEMEDASRGYGTLLSACSLRTEEMQAQYSTQIKEKVYREISSAGTCQKVKETLRSHEDHLGKVIELAWKFVTLPNPLIVCQPKKFDPQIHDPEHGHWDSKHKDDLIYTRPVVYRNYKGALACEGWVANTS